MDSGKAHLVRQRIEHSDKAARIANLRCRAKVSTGFAALSRAVRVDNVPTFVRQRRGKGSQTAQTVVGLGARVVQTHGVVTRYLEKIYIHGGF